jgi:phospholipase/carboxylesterase
MAAAPTWIERTLPARERPLPEEVPPLLVLLHGIGADENDLFPLATRLDPRLTIVSLRAPRPYHGGFAWFDIAFLPDGRVVPDAAGARQALDDLARWIAAAPTRLGTDPARTFLLGFSQGAMMSLGALATEPDRLAGVIALSGRYPADLFDGASRRETIARVPLLVAHGTFDDVLPVENGRKTRDALQSLSRDFTYREFPVGHAISDAELDLVAGWLRKHLPAR